MKILKKINKGLILTILVVLTLTIYLVRVEKQRKSDKETIRKSCEEFIEFSDKYLAYPEEMQKLAEGITDKQKKEHKDKMKTELEKIMINNEEAVKIQYGYLEGMLDNQGNEIRTNIDRIITKIKGYEFDGNQVTVTFNSKVDTDIKYLDGNEEKTRKDSFESTNDEIILQKVDDKWKVVSTNLMYLGYNTMNYDDTMMMY